MYYLLGFRILAQPENLLMKDEADDNDADGEFQRVKLTNSQLRKRRKAAHFTRSVIFNYVTDEVHTQVYVIEKLNNKNKLQKTRIKQHVHNIMSVGFVDFHPVE